MKSGEGSYKLQQKHKNKDKNIKIWTMRTQNSKINGNTFFSSILKYNFLLTKTKFIIEFFNFYIITNFKRFILIIYTQYELH